MMRNRCQGDIRCGTAPRTVLTPHIGYVTDDGYRVFYGEAVEDIAAFAAGRPVRVWLSWLTSGRT